MEDQQKPTKKIALNYGLLLGFVSVLINVAVYAMGRHYEQDWRVGVISFIIMVVIITLGIKKYKEANGGFLSLGQGLKTGIGIALIGVVISIIYNLVFMNFIEPDFIENLLEVTRQKLIDNPKVTEEVMEAQMKITEKMLSPVINIGLAFAASLFFGFVISLIASLIMKKSEEDQY